MTDDRGTTSGASGTADTSGDRSNSGDRSRGEPPLVLITNDDGVAAPGIRHLAAAAVAHGLRVVVAAPLTESSGSSAALTAAVEEGRIVVRRHQFAGTGGPGDPAADLADVPAYGVGGSPAYIVVLAMLGAFGPPPDLVFSGINRGANAGYSVLHSGTVGAALVAGRHGLHAMAVSLDVLSPAATEASAASGGAAIVDHDPAVDEARHWRTAADEALDLLPSLLATPAGTVLNLNVPDLPRQRLRGLRRARLARLGQTQMAIVESGAEFVRTGVRAERVECEPDSDIAYLVDGYATVTPIAGLVEVPEVSIPEAAPEALAR